MFYYTLYYDYYSYIVLILLLLRLLFLFPVATILLPRKDFLIKSTGPISLCCVFCLLGALECTARRYTRVSEQCPSTHDFPANLLGKYMDYSKMRKGGPYVMVVYTGTPLLRRVQVSRRFHRVVPAPLAQRSKPTERWHPLDTTLIL